MPLLPGVTGSAVFAGANQEHRTRLDRVRGEHVFAMPFALWIGMNPSRADPMQDDLTVRKEQEWTWRMGLSHYVKTNVGTYRATNPDDLSERGVCPVWPGNISMICDLALYADRIIASTGTPPPVLTGYARTLFRQLRFDGCKVECFGTTKQGWPKHSSRLGYNTPLVEYRI